jgi:GT2 family glycosyltransferase
LPQVNLIQAHKNLGFGKACNIGASYCNSDFILFLNPDARIYPDTLKNVLIFMSAKENSNIGICGVQLENESGEIARSSSRFPTITGLLSHCTGLSKLFPSLGCPMSEWDHSATKIVDQVIGAFFLVRQHIFVELNGFDEQFFVYFEEVDFSFRAKNHGWLSIYFAGTRAFHVGGGVSQQVKAHRLFYSWRSRLQYACKHFNLAKLIIVLFGTLFIELLSRVTLSAMNRSSASLKETFKAYALLYEWLFHHQFGEK